MSNAKLPAKRTRQWEHVYQGELARGLPPARAAAAAWAAVKRSGCRKVGTKWVCVKGRRVRA